MARRLTWAVLILIGVALSAGLWYSRTLHRHAETVVRGVYELSEQGNQPTVADLQRRFGDGLKRRECSSTSECVYEISISNRPLAALHIVPYSEMKTYFSTRNDVVLMSMTDFSVSPDRSYSVVTHVQIDYCEAEACRIFFIHPWADSSSLRTNGLVEIGRRISTGKKRAALMLNTGCLTRIGGCDNVAEILPTIWKANGRKITCAVQNLEGFVEKPPHWP